MSHTGPSRLQIKDNLLYTLHSGSFFPHSHNTLRRPRKQVFKKPHTSSFPFYCPQWCSSFIKSVLHATINQISVFDLVQNPSVCGIRLLQLSPALKRWQGNPASLPSVCSPAKVDLGHLLLASPQTHRTSCTPVIHVSLIHVFSPISPSTLLPVLETPLIPQVTTTLASVLRGGYSPQSTVLSPSFQWQHFLLPLHSSIEQKCTAFRPCTKYSNGKC